MEVESKCLDPNLQHYFYRFIVCLLLAPVDQRNVSIITEFVPIEIAGAGEAESDLDPNPLVRGTDPRILIKIRTKMSLIRNTPDF
jgi:hypothetical protein